MASMLDRVATRAASVLAERGEPQSRLDATLSLDQWAQFFSFGGLTYPLLQTTMGSVDKERIIGSSVAAFKGNSTVFSLIYARLQAFSQIHFQWTRFTGSMPGDLFGTQELSVLEQPYPHMRTAGLLGRMEVDASIAGNSYTVRPRGDRLGRLRPDLVTICLGSIYDTDSPADAPDVEIAGYAYFPRSGKPEFFWPWEVAHYAPVPDPDFQFLGMSWMTPVLREVQADSLATEHKYRFFQNAATPNLAIRFDPVVPVEHVREFKKLLENEHQGAFNAYKTLYLGGGADPVVIGKDFQQLDFAVTQGKGEARLAAAAGVPASWVGFSEGLQGSSLNAGNFNAQRRRFTDGTMFHLWQCAAEALESILDVPPGARLWFDNRVPFMREDSQDIAQAQQAQAQVIAQLVMNGFEAGSVVKAVTQNDFSLLKHSGLTSVQLHPPGEAPPLPGASNGKPLVSASTVNGNGSANGSGK